jgi:hypothetical protein
MVVIPKPRDHRREGPGAADVTRRVNEVLSRPASTPREEATNLEDAYSILNDALQ